MHERLLETLACPDCGERLDVAEGTADHRGRMDAGALECRGCTRSYPVVGGVPRLLPLALTAVAETPADRTVAHFEMEFTAPALAGDDADMSPADELEYVFFSRTGIDSVLSQRTSGGYRPDKSFLAGKRVLDGGCGPGRFLALAAETAEHVVGLEFGGHVSRAARRCRSLENVDLVQGSVLQPPFAPGVFDYVYTLGVLHHTPDPRLGSLRLAELVRPGGAMSIWVYPPEYWGDPLRGAVNRQVHARLARLPPAQALDICTRWLYPLGRLQAKVARRRWTKLLSAPLFALAIPRHPEREVMISTIYDRFGPAIISTHDYDEVQGWLRDGGFGQMRRVPVATAWFAEKPDQVERCGTG